MESELEIEDLVIRHGWSASRAELLAVVPRRVVERAVDQGRLDRPARGRYTLPGLAGLHSVAAEGVGGVLSHLSAAHYWGMPVRQPPPLPTVSVPRSRHLTPAQRLTVQAFRAEVPPPDLRSHRGVTSPARTVVDCAVAYPFADALVVADGALRRDLVTPDEIWEQALAVRPELRDRAVRIALEADRRPQSPLESLVRALSRDVPGLHLVPQVPVGGFHPDLYDEVLGLAVECDSFEHHAKRAHLLRDCERYNTLGVAEASSVRFGWEHAMWRPDYVRETLAAMAGVLRRRCGVGMFHAS